MSQVYSNFIGGEWIASASGATLPDLNPATEEVVGEFPNSDASDARRAVEAAAGAQAETIPQYCGTRARADSPSRVPCRTTPSFPEHHH